MASHRSASPCHSRTHDSASPSVTRSTRASTSPTSAIRLRTPLSTQRTAKSNPKSSKNVTGSLASRIRPSYPTHRTATAPNLSAQTTRYPHVG